MSSIAFYNRTILQEYSKQLLTTRRLARYHSLLYADVEPSFTKEQKRKLLVERVASEIFENLVFTGDDNVIVEEIRQELERKLGEKISFSYLPGEIEIVIGKESDDTLIPFDKHERLKILGQVWEIIVARVDATML